MELQLLGGAEADDSVGRAHGSDDKWYSFKRIKEKINH